MRDTALRETPIAEVRNNIYMLLKETMHILKSIISELPLTLMVVFLYTYCATTVSFWLGVSCAILFLLMLFYNCQLANGSYTTSASRGATDRFKSVLSDSYANVELINRYNVQDKAVYNLQKLATASTHKIQASSFKHAMRMGLNSLVALVAYVCTLSTILQQGQLTTVNIVFFTVLAFITQIQCMQFAKFSMSVSRYKRINTLVESYITQSDFCADVEKWKNISIDSTFQYADDTPVYSMNIKIDNGDFISIDGSGGIGKSTFAKILSRDLLVPNYCIDGEETFTKKVSTSHVTTDCEILDASLYDNLALWEDVPYDLLKSLLKCVGLWDWFKKLPNGFDTNLKSFTCHMSDSERQRLALVRGLLIRRDLYIIEEPAANLNRETRLLVYNLIASMTKGKTVIIISHDKEAYRLCNKHYEIIDTSLKEVV